MIITAFVGVVSVVMCKLILVTCKETFFDVVVLWFLVDVLPRKLSLLFVAVIQEELRKIRMKERSDSTRMWRNK
jgi:hypothetical protein